MEVKGGKGVLEVANVIDIHLVFKYTNLVYIICSYYYTTHLFCFYLYIICFNSL